MDPSSTQDLLIRRLDSHKPWRAPPLRPLPDNIAHTASVLTSDAPLGKLCSLLSGLRVPCEGPSPGSSHGTVTHTPLADEAADSGMY